MRISEIKTPNDFIIEISVPNIFDPDLQSKMAEQGNLRLKLLNQVNHMAEILARKDSGLSLTCSHN